MFRSGLRRPKTHRLTPNVETCCLMKDRHVQNPRSITRLACGLLSIILMVLLACAGGNRFHPNQPPPPETKVIIHNNNFLDMWVYLDRGAETVRLGRISGNRTTTLTIPPEYTRTTTVFRFRFNPIGGLRNQFSQEITINSGDQIEIVIPPSFD